MKLDHLKMCLQYCLCQSHDSDIKVLDKSDVNATSYEDTQRIIQDMINEVNALEERLKADDELLHGGVSLISFVDVIDIVNVNGYDIYGELYRENNNQRVSAEAYVQRCRERKYFEYFTDSMLKDGYDFIVDLYDDNEHDGYNNDAGHYDSGTPAKSIF